MRQVEDRPEQRQSAHALVQDHRQGKRHRHPQRDAEEGVVGGVAETLPEEGIAGENLVVVLQPHELGHRCSDIHTE
jgi:hypothetical protein